MIVSMLQAVPLAATTSSKVDQKESISAGVPSPDGDSDRDSHEPVESNKRLKANIEKGQFSCQTCNKSYSRIENLTRHSATHDAVSRFQCTICGKRFTRSDLLNRHKKIHGSMNSSPNTALHTANVAVSLRQKTHTPQQSYSSLTQGRCTPPPALLPPQNAYGHQHAQSISQQYHIPTQSLQSTPPAETQHSLYSTPRQAMPLPVWDGFMTHENLTTFNMGSYDADIAWTFDFAQTDMPYDFASPRHWGTPSVGDASDTGFPLQQQTFHTITKVPHQPVCDSTEDKTEVDEGVSKDWPDNLSGSKSPSRQLKRRPLDSQVWQSIEREAQRNSDQFAAYPRSFSGTIDYTIRASQIVALSLLPVNETPNSEISDAVYPLPAVLEYYLRLYFHHVHDRFPVIHIPTFDISRTAPLLLMTMILAGSNYAKADRGRFSSLFWSPLRVAVMKKIEIDMQYLRTTDNILTFLLLCLAGTWSGNKQGYEFAEGYRGILVTASRRSRLMDCRPTRQDKNASLHDTWLDWIETEKKRRLGICIYIYDCQYPSLFNNQMYISRAETTNLCFPCETIYFEAPSPQSWKLLLGYAETPPATFYLNALHCCLLRNRVFPEPAPAPASNFGKLTIIYAIFTHIFEWRQAISMLNPTGLFMVGGGNSAHDMGEGLRGRRRWLLDSLDNFETLYLTHDTCVAAAILHQLAYISLSVSLSDLHLAAGRLGSKEDSTLAEFALKSWANSSDAAGTMIHVDKVLDLAHKALRDGSATSATFEVAVALFQGGLVSWAYHKLRGSRVHLGVDRIHIGDLSRRTEEAGRALREMGTWRMEVMFGFILKGFEGGIRS